MLVETASSSEVCSILLMLLIGGLAWLNQMILLVLYGPCVRCLPTQVLHEQDCRFNCAHEKLKIFVPHPAINHFKLSEAQSDMLYKYMRMLVGFIHFTKR